MHVADGHDLSSIGERSAYNLKSRFPYVASYILGVSYWCLVGLSKPNAERVRRAMQLQLESVAWMRQVPANVYRPEKYIIVDLIKQIRKWPAIDECLRRSQTKNGSFL